MDAITETTRDSRLMKCFICLTQDGYGGHVPATIASTMKGLGVTKESIKMGMKVIEIEINPDRHKNLLENIYWPIGD